MSVHDVEKDLSGDDSSLTSAPILEAGGEQSSVGATSHGTTDFGMKDGCKGPRGVGAKAGGPNGSGGRGGGGPPPPHVLAKIGMKALAKNGSILLFVIWCAGVWLFCSNSGSQDRAHNLSILVRDFDGGAFGQGLMAAVNAVNGKKNFPTFVISTDASASDVSAKVFDGTYWASISVSSGATAAFNTTLTSAASATSYNATTVYTYHAATVRYYTSYVSYVYPGLLEVLDMAEIYAAQFAVAASANAGAGQASLDSAQLAVIASPARHTFVDVAPLPFQSRVFLNTFSTVISHLSQFFFNMILNGIFLGVGIYRNTTFLRLIQRKYPIKILWTLVASLSITAFAAITSQGFDIGAKNFFALWAAEWIYAIINFNTIGTALVFIPLPFMTMFVFPWVVTSIAATIAPIELSNVFYRISYIFPSHAWWNTAITIWGKGAVNRLYIYLPILAAWIVISEVAWLLADLTLAKRSTKSPAGPPGPPGRR